MTPTMLTWLRARTRIDERGYATQSLLIAILIILAIIALIVFIVAHTTVHTKR